MVFILDALIRQAKQTAQDPFKRFLILIVLTLAGYSLAFVQTVAPIAPQQFSDTYTVEIHFFYHPACIHCKEQLPFNQQIAQEYKNAKWVYHDISIPEKKKLLDQMLAELGKEASGVPVTIINKTVFVGFDRSKTPEGIKKAISGSDENETYAPQSPLDSKQISLPFVGTINPSSYSLLGLSFVLGLADGFNPCAMWVLVYLISITLTLNDRKRFLLVVGTFLFASAAVYFLILSAWLNAFLFVGYIRPVMVGLGAVALYWGISSLAEFWKNKGEMVCHVTDAKEKKKISGEIRNLLSSPLSATTFIGLIVLAFTINSVEFICSAAIPAVFTHVLSLASLSLLEYYFYISVYVLMYMLDDILVFSLAYFAIGGIFGNKIASFGHAAGAILLVLLGLALLFAPSLLIS